MLEGLRVGLEELAELRSHLVLLDWSKFLESGCEGVFKRPDIASVKGFVAWMDEVFLMDCLEEFDRKPLGHERTVNHALRFRVGERVLTFEVNRLSKRLPAPLNPVNAHRN